MATTVPAGAVGSPLITLVANTVTQVDLLGGDSNAFIEVITATTPASDIWWTIDSTTPAVGVGYYIPAGTMAVDKQPAPSGGDVHVQLISTGTPTVRVQRVN